MRTLFSKAVVLVNKRLERWGMEWSGAQKDEVAVGEDVGGLRQSGGADRKLRKIDLSAVPSR